MDGNAEEGAVGPSNIPMLNPRHASMDAVDLTKRDKSELKRPSHRNKQGLKLKQG